MSLQFLQCGIVFRALLPSVLQLVECALEVSGPLRSFRRRLVAALELRFLRIIVVFRVFLVDVFRLILRYTLARDLLVPLLLVVGRRGIVAAFCRFLCQAGIVRPCVVARRVSALKPVHFVLCVLLCILRIQVRRAIIHALARDLLVSLALVVRCRAHVAVCSRSLHILCIVRVFVVARCNDARFLLSVVVDVACGLPCVHNSLLIVFPAGFSGGDAVIRLLRPSYP